MNETVRSPAEIWADDLFSRKLEAEHLIAYIESVAGRPILRQDKRAYTIAIDAGYGGGKSFFLRRLAEHLSLNHPVAFVDAWADDLTDEPLTALVATLKQALDPLVAAPDVRSRLSDFLTKTGKVAKIVGWGVLRRGAGLLLTGKAVDAAEDVLADSSEDMRDAINDGLTEAGQGTVDDAIVAVKSVTGHRLMEERVTAFENGKAAVRQMKESLEAIVTSLDGVTLYPPIIIVIDELDRCRPTYAIRLLEEIKHLFDVPGIVFVLAIHTEQLAHSVSGVYGSNFDGRAYLRRFIDRRYSLEEPRLVPLLEKLVEQAGLRQEAFTWPHLVIPDERELTPTVPELLAEYMQLYGLGPRDAFALMDVLQTSAALVGQEHLHLHYFLPLAIGVVKGFPPGTLPVPVAASRWAYLPNWSRLSGDVSEISLPDVAAAIDGASKLSRRELEERQSEDAADYALRFMRGHRAKHAGEPPLWSPQGYVRLLGAVSRFSNPQLEA